MRIAVADIGGTHARFALAEVNDGQCLSLSEPVTLGTRDHASFQTAWREFGERIDGDLPQAISIAFAGPVDGEVLKLTNNPWVIRPALAQEKLGVTRFKVINDFAAVAHAVGALKDEHFDHIAGPEGPLPSEGVTSIVGPGTGLGVAQLLKTGGHAHVIATEGGHIDFAPLDGLEDKMLERLRKRYRRVSVERIACGSGLANIYEAIGAIEGKAVRELDDRELWALAMSGEDPLAAAALDRFFLSLGAVAGDLALAHGANAVVLAGGLGYRIRHLFASSGFSDRFIAKGRFERRMEAIPVKLVTHPQPGLLGAAVAFAKDHS
ncbi:glucokinase [Sphingomicrobium lutaoense]|uniref:Glucokinase n=1 Tax=Sphingomicrobium lutaoense TaxID=515949 RepID=A0A839Z0R6_9SPHN|nr:glucokinase [Sphingomicrobium lutaoense]MBB3763155.1 glucokinase [Sphingomicrobium lutaoense]